MSLSQVQLIDSSEFHGTPEREWNYKLFKWRQILVSRINLKVIFYVILWFIAGRISLEVKLHGIFVIFTGFGLIFFNLGERKDGTMSAYSVFNKSYYNLIGTFKASDVDSMFVKRNDLSNTQTTQLKSQVIEDITEFDGLSEDQMMQKLNKLGNKSCFCNSGRKYKKCHYLLQFRAKQLEEEEEMKAQKLSQKKQ